MQQVRSWSVMFDRGVPFWRGDPARVPLIPFRLPLRPFLRGMSHLWLGDPPRPSSSSGQRLWLQRHDTFFGFRQVESWGSRALWLGVPSEARGRGSRRAEAWGLRQVYFETKQ